MKTDAKITIIGAGVIGLALAYELSKEYDDVFVIEKNKNFGEETSCRSSEVIHSGIYYPRSSLKAKLCVEGRILLYSFCDKYGVGYNKCGKLIIANTDKDIKELDKLKKQASDNGVDGVRKIEKEDIAKLEPNIRANAALFLSETGVVNSYEFMKELEIISINNGVQFVYGSEVKGLNKNDNGYEFVLNEYNSGTFSFTSDIIINSAGLNSDRISNMIGIENFNYDLNYCKGEYFAVGNGKNKLVNRLIYPVPNANLIGLGVHVTIDIDKGLKLGPNTIYLKDKKIDYTVDIAHKDDFFKSARQFLPFLEKEDLYPAYAGIRPKLQKEGDAFRDFIIREEKEKGFKNYFNLIGIESPGLTASLAIAKYVSKLVNKN